MKKRYNVGNVLPTVIVFIVVVSIMSVGVFSITLTASKAAINANLREMKYFEIENITYDFLEFYCDSTNRSNEEEVNWYYRENTFTNVSDGAEYTINVKYVSDVYTIKVTNDLASDAIETCVTYDLNDFYTIQKWGKVKW